MMLSDPEVESAVLISSDEGASFEKHPISFNILSLLFHPAQENWILAYSHDSKVVSEQIPYGLLSRNKKIYCAESATCYIVWFSCDVMFTVLLIHNIILPKTVIVMKIGLILSCSCTAQWTLGGNGCSFMTT